MEGQNNAKMETLLQDFHKSWNKHDRKTRRNVRDERTENNTRRQYKVGGIRDGVYENMNRWDNPEYQKNWIEFCD